MSQQDFDISTVDANTGVTFRAAVNAALQALASSNSGPSEPGIMYPCQIWIDTTNHLIKMRNETNTAWITLGKADTGFMSNATSATNGAPVGAVMEYFLSTAPDGWLFLDGKTIGDASSGATGRANADTLALYTGLWDSMDNAKLPIQDSAGTPTTRGSSAATDFAAHKRLSLPNLCGRALIGVGQTEPPKWTASTTYAINNCVRPTASYNYVYEATSITTGTSAASEPTWPTTVGNSVVDGGVTWTCRAKWSNRVLGVAGGAETHTQIQAELASHTHSVYDPGHYHSMTSAVGINTGSWNQIDGGGQQRSIVSSTSSATTGISLYSAGSNSPMTIMNPFVAVNYIIRY